MRYFVQIECSEKLLRVLEDYRSEVMPEQIGYSGTIKTIVKYALNDYMSHMYYNPRYFNTDAPENIKFVK